VGVMRGAVPARMCHIAVIGKGGGSRLPHKKREMQRRGPFTEWIRVAVFKASAPYDHGAQNGRLTCPSVSIRSPRVLHAIKVAGGGGGKPGRR
jgi:hypothetical protein